MDHFKKIYATKASEYHQMILPEDVDGNLFSTIQEIAPLGGARLLDLGSGTGRIPLLVYEMVSQLVALDLNYPMLAEQRVHRQRAGGSWFLVNGDNRRLPLPDDSIDILTAGWAIGHLRSWYAADWQTQIGLILAEMERVAAPGGKLIIIETLTTGALEPAPPTPELAEYYAWLEGNWGYTRHTIRTDYQFDSVEDAVAKTEFFFKSELAERIRQNQWVRLPEWSGVWAKSLP